MKKTTNWDLYFQKQMGDPEMKAFVEEELKALRVGTELVRLRQRKHLSQTQLAARVGMSAPNISRIENSPSPNLTLGTMLKLFSALGYDLSFKVQPRRSAARVFRAVRA